MVLKQLQATAPRDVAELLPHLEKRGSELADGAKRLLAERGERESQAMREILEQQRKRIATAVEANRDRTPGLFDQEEMRQLDADRRHWDRRLKDIDQELRTEPERVQERLCGEGPACRAGGPHLLVARYGLIWCRFPIMWVRIPILTLAVGQDSDPDTCRGSGFRS